MNHLDPIASLLDEKELNQLREISDELFDAFNKNQIFRTETEARFAVLNDMKFPTKAAKYWQSVREQMCHFNELVRLSFEVRRKKIDLQEIEDKLKTATGYDKDRLEVDKDEIVYTLAHSERIAKDRVREVMQWSMLKKEVNDGSFDDKDVNTHQRESLFKSVVTRMSVAKDNISTEERLSLNGIINALSKEDVNKELAAKLLKKE